VVLRPGPPRNGRRGVDAAAAVVGVLLLAASVVLVYELPEEDVIVPQYRVAFTTYEGEDFPTQRIEEPIGPGGFIDITYGIPQNNVFAVGVTVEYQDDEPSTLPDEFELELVAPNGTVIGLPRVLVTADPERTDPGEIVINQTDPFLSPLRSANLQFDVVARPTDVVVDAAARNETLEEAQDRLLPQHTVETNGAWILRVTLREAGGCPAPGSDPDDAFRAAYCLQEADRRGGVEDPGNGIAITKLTYSYYGVEVLSLDT